VIQDCERLSESNPKLAKAMQKARQSLTWLPNKIPIPEKFTSRGWAHGKNDKMYHKVIHELDASAFDRWRKLMAKSTEEYQL